MNPRPVVSVCCITYNQEKYIHDAIKGFLMQKTNFPIEIIIHDDASTDKTQEVIREYVAKDKRIIPVLRKTNIKSTGVIMLPIVVKYARGKYIAICEGDDFWTDPYKLQKQVDLLEKHPDYSACFHAVKIISAKNNKTIGYYKQTNQDKVYYPDQWYEIGSMQTSMFFRGKYVVNLPNWVKNAPIGSVPMRLFLSQQGKFAYIDEIMSVYRLFVPNSFTLTKTLNLPKNYEISKKMVRMYDGFNEYTNFKYAEIVALKQLNYLIKELKVNKNLGKLGFLKKHRERIHDLSFKKKMALLVTLFFPKIYRRTNTSRQLQFIRKFILKSK